MDQQTLKPPSENVGDVANPYVDYWLGNIENTSFDQVIFSPCGKVFKKGVGWDGKSSWMYFDRKEDIFQWVLTKDCPHSEFGSELPTTMNENSLWWNFQMFDGPTDKELGTRVKIFSGQWKGSWSRVPYQWDLISEKDTTVVARDGKGVIPDHDYEFYKEAFPLTELPIYNPGKNTWEDHEGWTHCLEEPDWVDNLVSCDEPEQEQQEQEEQQEQQEQEQEQQEQEEEQQEQEELRADPFDGNFYTKKEFLNYYGTTLQWRFMSEEKTFKRDVIGKWIVENGRYMRKEATNYLLDKMIETFV